MISLASAAFTTSQTQAVHSPTRNEFSTNAHAMNTPLAHGMIGVYHKTWKVCHSVTCRSETHARTPSHIVSTFPRCIAKEVTKHGACNARGTRGRRKVLLLRVVTRPAAQPFKRVLRPVQPVQPTCVSASKGALFLTTKSQRNPTVDILR